MPSKDKRVRRPSTFVPRRANKISERFAACVDASPIPAQPNQNNRDEAGRSVGADVEQAVQKLDSRRRQTLIMLPT